MEEELSVALLQCELSWENPSKNRTQIEIYLERVKNVDIVLLPEMFTTAFSVNAIHLAEPMNGESILWMKEIAKEKQFVLCGSMMIQENENIYNRLLWVDPNGGVQYYDKRHLFGLINEEKNFTPGKKRLIIDYKGWRICPLICYDLRFPIFSRNDVAYDVCFYLANWPNTRITAWDVLLKARAIENQAYCLGVNRVGVDGYNTNYSGHTQVVGPEGDVITSAPENELGFIEVKLCKEYLNRIRKRLPFLEDRDGFEIQI